MDEWSVDRAVIAPSDEFVAIYNDEGNRRIGDLARLHPDRFSGLAVANPWYGNKALDCLRRAFEDGMVGLYMHPGRQGFHLTERVIDPLIELCIEYSRPIYSHTGAPVCSMPHQLAELAGRHPDAQFIMGHAAWSDFGGYDAIPAVNQASNITVEMSCTAPGFVGRFICEVGPGRALFGSAYPRSRYAFEIPKIKGLNLPRDVYEKLMSGNARRLWRIGCR